MKSTFLPPVSARVREQGTAHILFVACIYYICVYSPIYAHVCKKTFCVDLLFPAATFSAKCESNMIPQSFESGPDLHITLRINGGTL